MPPKNPKPLRPVDRGEVWELYDGRKVRFLQLLAINEGGRCLEVINEKGALDTVYESEFRKRIEPPLS